MKPVRALILRTAGTNCELETAAALEGFGVEITLAHVLRLSERPDLIEGAQLIVVPGGFSYGDDLGAGRILATLLRHRFEAPLSRHLDRGGLLLGVCNGFQALVQAGLLPGFTRFEERPPITLTLNESGRFQCEWVTLEIAARKSPFLARLPARVEMPIAHAEGRLVARDDEVRDRLIAGGHVAFRYAPRFEGDPRPNPNGSELDIAGLIDATGQILGVMPHPERHAQPWQHPLWQSRGPGATATAGALFAGAIEHLRAFVA